MFNVGEKVRCINSRDFYKVTHLPGLAYRKKMIVTQTRNWDDGSQSIWVKFKSHDVNTYGPYISIRFEPLNKPAFLEYDPTQQGEDTDDI